MKNKNTDVVDDKIELSFTEYLKRLGVHSDDITSERVSLWGYQMRHIWSKKTAIEIFYDIIKKEC